MSVGEANTDATYEAALNEHYGVTNLAGEILEAFENAGKDVDALTREDISSFDEFHIRGLEAPPRTRESREPRSRCPRARYRLWRRRSGPNAGCRVRL